MSWLPRRQRPALAKTRGDLRAYERCGACNGCGVFDVGLESGLAMRCGRCNGTGRVLVDQTSETRANVQARDTRNEALKHHGRQPYD